jgi:hypothetical protein
MPSFAEAPQSMMSVNPNFQRASTAPSTAQNAMLQKLQEQYAKLESKYQALKVTYLLLEFNCLRALFSTHKGSVIHGHNTK